jgi:hypothetical protein
MKIIKRIQVPTGDICIVEGEKGKYLEFYLLEIMEKKRI